MSNRLASAKSAYLKTAADSPIDWYPWGDEAFERARKEDKPVLLDIGAVWCHWCHVMDHKTYEHPEVIKMLNERFVCIKVDRDERPDIDVRYQQAVAAISGSGGWPLTGFLTPDGEVFFGGTYFPPEDAHGRAGFPSVLSQIDRTFREEREKVDHAATHISEVIANHLDQERGAGSLDGSVLEQVPKFMAQRYDPKFGGFGQAPKFPHTAALQLAIARAPLDGSGHLRQMVTRTLQKMAAGGIHDRLAGGFHRYSVDAHWTVPHFEKMAYDNSELLRAYAHAIASFDEAAFVPVVHGIVAWLLDESPETHFLASQDADQDAEDDGDFFTWTLAEMEAACEGMDPNVFEVARRRFGVEAHGDMHHDPARNVLELEMSHEEIAAQLGITVDASRGFEDLACKALRSRRATRAKPYVDVTCYTNWNAMLVSAILEADALLASHDGVPDDTKAMLGRGRAHALRALDHIIDGAWSDQQGWMHRLRDDGGDQHWGFLDDQVWMGQALLDAYRFTGTTRYLDLARATADLVEREFVATAAADGDRDASDAADAGTTGGESDAPDAGRAGDDVKARDVGDAARPRGLADTSHARRMEAKQASLQAPHVPVLDQGQPGPNPIGARFLIRLGRCVDESRYIELGEAVLAAGAGAAPGAGIFAGAWFLALHEWATGNPVATVYGYGDEGMTVEQLEVARATIRPGVMVHHVEPGTDHARVPALLHGVLDNEDLIKDGAVTLVCHGDRCGAPLRDVEQIALSIMDRSRPSDAEGADADAPEDAGGAATDRPDEESAPDGSSAVTSSANRS